MSQATTYRLIKIFQEGGTVTSLLGRTRGRPKGFRTLDQNVGARALAAPRDRADPPGEIARRKHPYAQQIEAKHGIVSAHLHAPEDHQQHAASHDAGDDQGIAPPHRGPAPRHQAVGQADEENGEANAEGDVAPGVKARLVTGARRFRQAVLRPQGPGHAEGNTDREDQPPMQHGQKPARHQSDHAADDHCKLVDAEREPASVSGKYVGQDRVAVGEQEGGAHTLEKDGVRSTGGRRRRR